MSNAIRGEVELRANAKTYRLLLTLGALAEIQAGLALDNFEELPRRLKQKGAAALTLVVGALMRGAGEPLQPDEVLKLDCTLGTLVAAVREAFERGGLPCTEGSGPFAGTPGSPTA
ncbi:MAG: gene transfer agent family protein [Alphaproteobacteria bacterium]|nr:gene transfer agent family protein [Alphaproteobacteria bacterium]